MVLLQPYCNRASTEVYAMDASVREHLDKFRKRPDQVDAMV